MGWTHTCPANGLLHATAQTCAQCVVLFLSLLTSAPPSLPLCVDLLPLTQPILACPGLHTSVSSLLGHGAS